MHQLRARESIVASSKSGGGVPGSWDPPIEDPDTVGITDDDRITLLGWVS
jgi:hypothetical protein